MQPDNLLHVDDADDVVELLLVGWQAGVIAVDQLLDEQCRLRRQIDRLDQASRRHDIVDADRIEVEQVREHRPMLAAQVLTLQDERSELFLGQRRVSGLGGPDGQHLEKRLDEEVHEPDDRRGNLEHRREDVAHNRRKPIGVRCTDDLGGDLGEHEQGKRNSHRAQRERELAFAEQPLGDHRRHRRRGGSHQRVAEKDHAEQLIGLTEE